VAEDRAQLHVEARDWAADWCRRWFLDEAGRDRFRIESTDAGWATHVEAYLLLLELALEALGIARTGGRQSPLRWLKAHGYDRALRSAALRVAGQRVTERHELAAIVEIPTPSMMEPAALVAEAASGSCAVGTTDPRALRRLRARGLAASAIVSGVAEEQRMVRAARRSLDDAWRSFEARPPAMTLRGRDLGAAAARRLAPLVQRSMPYLVPERAALERFVEVASPRAVAIAADQHRGGRLSVAICRAAGLRSVVLQHGLPQGPIGYLPVVADTVATWSAASGAWFESHGTDADRLEITGNPRTDQFYAAVPGSTGAPHLVVALSPAATDTNVKIVGGVIGAARKMPDARWTIKLHPGQSSWEAVEALVQDFDGRNIRLQRFEPLGPLLAGASHVVVHRSTVAVEALAAHVPVLVYRAGSEPTTADAELRDLRLPVVEAPDQLMVAVRDLSHEPEIEAYFASRQHLIEHVTGPVDGQSAQRIVALMRRGPDQR
jgi:hypothetical protein